MMKKIISLEQARCTIKPGMILDDMGDYMFKVLAVNEKEYECIDVEYDDVIGYFKEVGTSYTKPLADFIDSYVD